MTNWSGAEHDATRALALGCDTFVVWKIRGQARYKLTRLKEARSDLDEAISREPSDPATFYWRGLARRDSGDDRSAVADFDAAIMLNERYAEAYVARGKARANLGEMAEARSDWAIAAQMLHQSH